MGMYKANMKICTIKKKRLSKQTQRKMDISAFPYFLHPKRLTHPHTILAGVVLGTISSYGLALRSSSDIFEPAEYIPRGGTGEY